ncbi:3-dehydroquinate synthase [Granulicoccus sp. GXG6511]|uniref:3-dehydroquinate synthase n=1 Tax=Granulicoccus sp. GXG6511 TaxID=3381351 RepID=UPI003D7C903F
MTDLEVIRVAAERPYEVHTRAGALELLPDLVGDTERVALLYAPVLRERASALAEGLRARVTMIELPDAEAAKTAEVLVACWDRLAAEGFTRSDLLIALGGGATTDLGGFVAASWLRGIRFVTVPTTVLGMVDAAVGGKTGINISAGKNLVGAFHEPIGVLCDLSLLRTLPEADLRAGMVEAVKCGFIADPVILDLVEEDPVEALRVDSDRLAEIVRRGIAVKARVVSADLREATSKGATVGREILNYGHTLGHAVEKLENYRMRHGEAVGIGMIYVAELARLLGRIDDDLAERHRSVLAALGVPTTYRPDAWPALREAMSLDKKTRGSTLRFVLLNGLGSAEICAGPGEDVLAAAYARFAG